MNGWVSEWDLLFGYVQAQVGSEHEVAAVRMRLDAGLPLLLREEDLHSGRAHVTEELDGLGEDAGIGLIPLPVLFWWSGWVGGFGWRRTRRFG